MTSRFAWSLGMIVGLLLTLPGALFQTQDQVLLAQDEVSAEIQKYEAAKKQFEAQSTKASELSEKYRSADRDEQVQISKEYNALTETLDISYRQFRNAAIAAYKTHEGEHETLETDMVRIVATETSLENYHFAFDVAQLIFESGKKPDDLLSAAGMAAFGSNRFKEAKEYWDKAEAAGLKDDAYARFKGMLPEMLKSFPRELAIRKEEASQDDLPRVLIKTNRGNITIELFENQAPGSVGNFISLVEDGFYDGLTFHRVLPNFMAQGGCPDGSGSGGPDYKIFCETGREDYRHHYAGTLSMAHAGKDTGGSQFFLTFVPTPHLDGRHTAFGRVIDGWEVLSKLQRIDPRRPVGKPDIMESVEVLRKRDHEYVPNKVNE